MTWYYLRVPVSESIIPEWAVGFVYKITHKPSGYYYIGKKALYSYRNVKIGKRELEEIKEDRSQKGIKGRLPKKKKVVKESDWEKYFSSNEWIKEQIKEGKEDDFDREILRFCSTKKSLTYWEVKYQMLDGMLENEKSLNNNILGTFYKKDVLEDLQKQKTDEVVYEHK